ncbi:hypothetical protein G195_006315 [Phytophthora kernoviae 00238/432]|uniref:Uncharacterized protein n=2 Tax=Phytophthora kernoviae TaxID=325452 RepID=A0A8T0LWP5_9STRA|nr:hypothetical protein G195_006315 [Phytophthora kernoviae 00238/432]KAG2523220.1 hypothetical protein JM16_003867 [Phytophthora kernoviae]
METRSKVKVRGTAGCELLRYVESVDPRAAEGLRREKLVDVPQDLDVLLEEETRRSITDAYQRLLFEVKVLHRKGNFKSSQGEAIVQRVRDVANGGKMSLDLSGFTIFDEFVDLLTPYLRSKSCNLANNYLDYLCSVHIAEMLKVNRALEVLSLAQNPLTDAGVVELSTGLKKNASLLTLNRHDNLAGRLERSNNKQAAGNDEDDEDIWDYPLC